MENLALKGCTEAHQILSKFFNRIKMLPISVGEAGDDHPLAQFSGDPVGCVGEDEDAWEKFNGRWIQCCRSTQRNCTSLFELVTEG
jgi:hypothetical protein